MAVTFLGLTGTLPAMRMLDVHLYRLNRDTSPISRRHQRRARVSLLVPMRCFMLCLGKGRIGSKRRKCLNPPANERRALLRAIWATSRRSAGMIEVVKCGVGDNPTEGHESLWDVSSPGIQTLSLCLRKDDELGLNQWEAFLPCTWSTTKGKIREEVRTKTR